MHLATHSPATLDYARPGIKRISRAPTVLEILMCMIMLAILSAVLVPRYIDHTEPSRISASLTDLQALTTAIRQFQADTGRLPTNDEGLSALLNCPDDLTQNWRGPYITHPAKDPWGNSYLYLQLPSGKFEVRSCGRDGAPNTADDLVQ